MALKIGFATEFYTLWDIATEDQYYADPAGLNHQLIGVKTYYWYQKNISKDIEKVKALYPGIEIDEELRGKTRSYDSYQEIDWRPQTQFSFGQLVGKEMTESNDVWQLSRASKSEKSPRRRVIARRRLIELGELIRYPHKFYNGEININWGKKDEYGDCLPESLQPHYKYQSYASIDYVNKEKEAQEEAKRKYGHFFSNGEKIILELKLIEKFSFGGMYGTVYVRRYVDNENRIFKYVGSSPMIKASIGEFVAEEQTKWIAFSGTVKNVIYGGNNETHLLRMKIVQEVETI